MKTGGNFLDSKFMFSFLHVFLLKASKRNKFVGTGDDIGEHRQAGPSGGLIDGNVAAMGAIGAPEKARTARLDGLNLGGGHGVHAFVDAIKIESDAGIKSTIHERERGTKIRVLRPRRQQNA
jgi:hypothetical protein